MDPVILLVAGSLAVAAFLQGLTGFGFGLTAMGLLPLWLPVRDAQTISTLVGIVVTALNVLAARKHLAFEGLGPLLVASCVAVPLGYQCRSLIPESSVRPWLGAALCSMVLWDFVGSRLRRTSETDAPASRSLAVFIGLFSGWLTGAFNIGGPPLVAYFYRRPWPVQRVVAVLSTIFLASGLMRLGVIVEDGRVTPPLLRMAALAMLPVLAGIWIGQRCLSRTNPRLLRAGVSVVLFGLGLSFLAGVPAPR